MNFNRQGALLNATMLAAVVAVLAGAVQRFLPTWQSGYLIAACFLVAIEASLVQHMVRAERMWVAELARYLVPEVTVMLVLMRVAATLSVGVATLGDDTRRWLYDPLSIFDTPFVSFILIGLLVGGLAHAGTRDLQELAPQPFESPALLDEGNLQYIAVIAGDRAAALGRISSRFVVGGALLLCALGLEAVNIQRIAGPSRAISAQSAIGALLYLISGFLLYSQGRLALLQARWRLEGVPVATSVVHRWTRASWLLIVGIAGAALLPPRTYGLGLLDTLRGALGLLGYVITLISYVVLWLFTLLMFIPAWLLSLFPARGLAPPPVPRPIAPPPPPPDTHEPRLLTALIFWACMLGLAGYALWIVAQRHPGLLTALTRRGPLAWLLRRLGWLWRDTRSWVGQAAQAVQARLHRPSPGPLRQGPALRLRRLAPRELVRYFYRSTLRRAAAGGLPRREAQTPYEYVTTLAERLPEAQQDIADLTEAFVVAHYSRRPVGSEEARRARQPWQRVRRRLRALRDRSERPAAPGDTR